MNLAGMTLKQIVEKLGVNAATVCRDLEWVRQQWRKSAVEDFEKARAIELARLNLVKREGLSPLAPRKNGTFAERNATMMDLPLQGAKAV